MASIEAPALVNAHSRPTISFEIMPPRNPEIAPKFWATARRLAAAQPDFISVTYGAAGTDRDTSQAVVKRITEQTSILPIAHLTCVGTSRSNVADTIAEFLSAGARTFLALRGDPPKDQPNWQPPADGVHSSKELIALVREVESKRCRANAASALRSAAKPLTIAVATFLDGNSASGTTREQEIEHLYEKQVAGANFAITQLFFNPSSYVEFVSAARAAGVTIPILAGILPTTDPARLRRVAELTGVAAPQVLLDQLDAITDPAERYRVGLQFAINLSQEVLRLGAPGLHIYTFNQSDAAIDLLEALNLGPQTTLFEEAFPSEFTALEDQSVLATTR